MLIGKNIAKIFINYNSCLFISNIFLIFSLFMLLMIKVNDYKNNDEYKEISLSLYF